METGAAIAVTATAGYLLGALPFAVIIARLHGTDIFLVGSGNPGATNVLRALGKGPGYACFALDALKGFAAASWPTWVLQVTADTAILLAVVGTLAAIVGHSFSVFIRFRGGKGVATTVGGLLGVNALVIAIGLVVWLLTFFTTRYVSLASILMGLSLPLASFTVGSGAWAEKGLVLALAALIVMRHKSNIQRLVNGTENRFTRKS